MTQPVKKKRNITTPEQAHRMVAYYNGGMSIRAIAEQMGCSYGKVWAALNKAAVPMRSKRGK